MKGEEPGLGREEDQRKGWDERTAMGGNSMGWDEGNNNERGRAWVGMRGRPTEWNTVGWDDRSNNGREQRGLG